VSRVLVVDDDANVRQLLTLYLEKEGFEVVCAADGPEGLRLAREPGVGLVVLDIMLPGMDGWEVCRSLRRDGDGPPVIMLTARGEAVDRIVGLELGADDYVCKPFNPRELVARVKAVLRRSSAGDRRSAIRGGPAAEDGAGPGGGPRDDGVGPVAGGAGGGTGCGDGCSSTDVISYPGLSIDPGARRVQVGDAEVDLTPKEFDLLCLLAEHPDRAFSRDHLLQRVWGYEYAGDTRTVDTHVKRLRQKLSLHDGNAPCIRTVWGVGYRFEGPRS